MASVFELFGTSESAAEDGKWFPFSAEMSVKIRRFKSKKSRKVREALEAPYKRVSQLSPKIPDEDAERIASQHVAEGIVVDWKGVLDTNGNSIPYSVGAALDLFEKLPEFRDAVIEISLNIENFREEEKAEVKGN
jgi:hypothetical protein